MARLGGKLIPPPLTATLTAADAPSGAASLLAPPPLLPRAAFRAGLSILSENQNKTKQNRYCSFAYDVLGHTAVTISQNMIIRTFSNPDSRIKN
jgi:hypothetical protein